MCGQFLGSPRPRVVFPNAPEWLPRRKLKRAILQIAADPDSTAQLSALSARVSSLKMVDSCVISRIPAGIFQRTAQFSVEVTPRKSRTSACDVIVNTPGVCLTFTDVLHPSVIDLEGRYILFHEGLISVTLTRPLFRYADFSEAAVTPSVFLRAATERQGFLRGYVHKSGVSTGLQLANGITTANFDVFCVNHLRSSATPPHLNEQPNYTGLKLGVRMNFADVQTRVECGCLSDRSNNLWNPLVRSDLTGTFQLPRNLSVVGQLGTTFSMRPLPLFERFHIGGIPTLRGIRWSEFSWIVDEVPTGIDHFLAMGISKSWEKSWLNGRAGFHGFLNGGMGLVREREGEKMPYMISFGVGAKLDIWGRAFEANFAIPVRVSPWIGFRQFQIGVDLLKSTKE